MLILQVIISYPSGEQKKDVGDEIADIVKYLSLGLYNTACKIVMVSPKLSQVVKGLVVKEMDSEMEELCKKKNNSILRQTKATELLEFKMENFVKEIEEKTPLFNQTLQSICCSNNKKRASTSSSPNPCVKATIAAAILCERCPEMSAIAYRTGLVLRHAGAGGMVCCTFSYFVGRNIFHLPELYPVSRVSSIKIVIILYIIIIFLFLMSSQ